MTKFKYVKKISNVPDDKLIDLENAYQLKRIADVLKHKIY